MEATECSTDLTHVQNGSDVTPWESTTDYGNVSSTYSWPVNTSVVSFPASVRRVIEMTSYSTPVIVVIGILGNTLSFVVFVTTHLRHQSSSVYLAFLNLVDTAFLLCLSVTWLGWINVPVLHREGVCQTVVYLSYVSGFLSVWTVVCFTVERFVVVYFPLRRLVYCTRRRALAVVSIMLGISLLIYSFGPVTIGVVEVQSGDGVTRECALKPQYAGLKRIVPAVDTAITLAVPSLLIVVFNVFILLKIWRFLGYNDGDPKSLHGTDESVTHAQKSMVEMTSPLSPSNSHHGQLADTAAAGKKTSPTGSNQPSGRRCMTSSRPWRDAGLDGCEHVVTPGLIEELGPPDRDNSGSPPPARYSALYERGPVSRTASATLTTHRRRAVRMRRHNPRSQALQVRTTRMLLTISTLFVVLNLPSHALRIGLTFTSPERPASESLLLCQLVFQMLYYANFSSNFFMYCACSRMFRQALKAFLANLGAVAQCTRH